ncbi:hypothetical protein [Agarilytica rhodophyticola]|uniref:hypothetical protein n=1 Tax=Agarilytica rhodophyticola TaxID=1737490 RepID=UPI000CD8B5A3|nr:hypothetical protein [Agarilytica rhodophyticola]
MNAVDTSYQELRKTLNEAVKLINESTERLIVIRGNLGTGKSTLIELGMAVSDWHYQGINKNDLVFPQKPICINTSSLKADAVNAIDHADHAENLNELLSWAQSSKNQGKCIIATSKDLPHDYAISYLDVYLDYSESPAITRRQPVNKIGK